MDSFITLDALLKEAGLASAAPASAPAAKKKKFLLVGTHAHQVTGYSKVTYHMMQELAKTGAFELYHFGIQKFTDQPPSYRPYPPDVDVYDPVFYERAKMAELEMGFGYSQLCNYVRKVKPDVLMIYNDASVVCQYLMRLEALTPAEKTYKLVVYLDQVYTIQRPELLARMEKDADAYFAFTQYWKERLEAQGVKKPVYVLRHGFDPTQFKVLDRQAMRKKHNIPENLIVFLNINRNTPRKRHDIVVAAFAELVARHPTRPLALLEVCDVGQGGGYPIQEIYLRELERLKVPLQQHAHKLMITQAALTYTDELINELYALSDVGITAADGEGFGLCQFEAMGIGIPQVVPYIGGFRDFCVGGTNSQTVEPKYRAYIPIAHSAVGGIIEVVDTHDLALAAEEYVLDSELRAAHGEAARKTVCAYTWSNEMKSLIDVLKHKL